jgi:hypothetical protein
MPRNDAMRHQWCHTAFIGGLGLSALAAMVLLLSAYFAGTAPRLPNNVAVLETLRTSGDLSPASPRLLNTGGLWSNADGPSGGVMREPNNRSRRPVNMSDLSAADHPFHPTGD